MSVTVTGDLMVRSGTISAVVSTARYGAVVVVQWSVVTGGGTVVVGGTVDVGLRQRMDGQSSWMTVDDGDGGYGRR